jgi:hypothetical protein
MTDADTIATCAACAAEIGTQDKYCASCGHLVHSNILPLGTLTKLMAKPEPSVAGSGDSDLVATADKKNVLGESMVEKLFSYLRNYW